MTENKNTLSPLKNYEWKKSCRNGKGKKKILLTNVPTGNIIELNGQIYSREKPELKGKIRMENLVRKTDKETATTNAEISNKVMKQ